MLDGAETVVTNSFSVRAPVDEVFHALLDLERVTPAMPGAKVLGRAADGAYKVAITVRLGPVTSIFRGDVQIIDEDPVAHRATMTVKAKEARGLGAAHAQVGIRLAAENSGTRGTIDARVQLSGKAAAMGHRVMEEVSAKLVETFAENLSSILAGPAASVVTQPTRAPGTTTLDAAEAPGERAMDSSTTTPGTTGEPHAPSSEQASESQADGGALRILPILIGVVAQRMRDPRTLGATLVAAAWLGYIIGRRTHR